MCSVLKNAPLSKRETLSQVFSCEFSEFSENSFFHRSTMVAVSVFSQKTPNDRVLNTPQVRYRNYAAVPWIACFLKKDISNCQNKLQIHQSHGNLKESSSSRNIRHDILISICANAFFKYFSHSSL